MKKEILKEAIKSVLLERELAFTNLNRLFVSKIYDKAIIEYSKSEKKLEDNSKILEELKKGFRNRVREKFKVYITSSNNYDPYVNKNEIDSIIGCRINTDGIIRIGCAFTDAPNIRFCKFDPNYEKVMYFRVAEIIPTGKESAAFLRFYDIFFLKYNDFEIEKAEKINPKDAFDYLKVEIIEKFMRCKGRILKTLNKELFYH